MFLIEYLRRTRAAINAAGLDVWVQVDGGISRATIESAAEAGANVFVAGSAIFSGGHVDAYRKTIDTLRSKAEEARA